MPGRGRPIIMLADHNQSDLALGEKILNVSYEVFDVSSAEMMFKLLTLVMPDLILLDVAMPDISGFEAIQVLKSDVRFADIPVVFLTSRGDEAAEQRGLDLGAADYVYKPLSSLPLLKCVEVQLLIKQQGKELEDYNDNLNRIVKEKSAQLFTLHKSVIRSVAELVESRDLFTGGHLKRLKGYAQILMDYLMKHGIYSRETVKWDDMDGIVLAVQAHDLGMLYIRDAVLNKPGKLTPVEFDIVKTHTAKGALLIRSMMGDERERQVFLMNAEIAAGTHHERWDGRGYPSGLKGTDIPLLGRLAALVDVYDALTSRRSYKPPFSTGQSAEIIVKGSRRQFDPVLVDVFVNTLSKFDEYSEFK